MTKRNKPRLAITVDKEVFDWVQRQARTASLLPSQFINQLLASAMKQESEHVTPAEPENSGLPSDRHIQDALVVLACIIIGGMPSGSQCS